MNTWYALSSKTDRRETEISIFDEIGMFGVSAKQFISDLQKVPADHKISLRIHSPGGEVFDGNAIYNALKRHPGGVEVQIEGLAASMATVISLAGLPVKMAANGFYMIHNPWGVAMGDASELRDQAELLDKIRFSMVGAYAAKSGRTPEEIEKWMDAETWFTAEEALEAGFVDEVTDTLALAASANNFSRLAKFRNLPANLTPTHPQMEIEPPIEEVAASVVSESASPAATEPAPVEEAPAPVEEAPAPVEEAPVLEEPAPEPAPLAEVPATPAPLASLPPAADAILAKYSAVLARAEAAEARAAELSSALEKERESFSALERSLGLAPARTVPVIENAAPESSDPVAEYLAAVEAGDRKAASALFEKHKAAIWQHRAKISKA